MLVFPKSYSYNEEEPAIYPFEGFLRYKRGANDWIFDAKETGFDYTRPNPKYFQNLEDNIEKLDQLGIEADLILFSPYDRWGFARMGLENNLWYLKYVIARLASYKNVWWALANEYDLMDLVGQIPLKDWDRIGQFVHEKIRHSILNRFIIFMIHLNTKILLRIGMTILSHGLRT